MAPVTTRAGLKPEEYDNAVCYMEDIIEMPTWYARRLQDQDWINEHIPFIVQQAVPVRALTGARRSMLKTWRRWTPSSPKPRPTPT